MTQLEQFLLMLDAQGISYEKEIEDGTTDIHFEFDSADCYFIFSKDEDKLIKVTGSANFYSE